MKDFLVGIAIGVVLGAASASLVMVVALLKGRW